MEIWRCEGCIPNRDVAEDPCVLILGPNSTTIPTKCPYDRKDDAVDFKLLKPVQEKPQGCSNRG